MHYYLPLLYLYIFKDFVTSCPSYNSHPDLPAETVAKIYFSISHLGLIQYNEYLMPSHWGRISDVLKSEGQNVCDIVVSVALLTGNRRVFSVTLFLI